MIAAFRKSRFARNWSFLVVSNLLCQMLGMLATIRIARVLLPERYGQYNLVQAFAGIGVVLAGLGFRHVVIREIARHPEQSGLLLRVTFFVRLVIWIIVGLGMFIYTQSYQTSLDGNFFVAIIVIMVGISSWEILENIAFGLERMEFTAGINLAGSVVWCVVAWTVPVVWITALNVSLAFALLQIIEVPIYYIALLRGGILPHATMKAPVLKLLHEGAPFYWLALLTMATNQIPVLLLANSAGQVEIGYFNAALRLVMPMQMLALTALSALYPSLSQSYLDNGALFMSKIEHIFIGIIVIGTSAALIATLLRKELVLFLFGIAYEYSSDVMVFQIWFLVFGAIYAMIGTVLAASDNQVLLMRLSTCYAIISIPILWWFSRWGAIGIAAGLLVSSLVNFFYHWHYFCRILPQRFAANYPAKLFAVIGFGLLVSWLIPQGLAFYVRIMASFLIFAVSGCLLVVLLAKKQAKMLFSAETKTASVSFSDMTQAKRQ